MSNTHMYYSLLVIHVEEQPEYRRDNPKTQSSAKINSFIIEDFI